MTRDALVERVRRLLADEPAAVSERTMFGGVSFFLDGAMILSARPGGDLLVRVATDRHDELVDRPGASWARMGRDRRMGRGWLVVAAEAVADDAGLAVWLDLARQHHRATRRGDRATASPAPPDATAG